MRESTVRMIVNSMPSSDKERNFNGEEDKAFAVPDGIVKLAPLESREKDAKTEVYMPDDEYPPRPTRLFLEFGVGSEKVIVAKECTVIYGL